MIICPNCNSANREGSRFCNECGTRLSVPSASAARPAAPSAAVPAETAPRPDEPPAELIAALPAAPAPSAASQRLAEAEPEDDVPDWLRDLRQAGLTTAAEVHESTPVAAEVHESTSAVAEVHGSTPAAAEVHEFTPAAPPPAAMVPAQLLDTAPAESDHARPDASAPARETAEPENPPLPAGEGRPLAPVVLPEVVRESSPPATGAAPKELSPLAARLAARQTTRTFQAVPSEDEAMPDWLRALRGSPDVPPPAPVEPAPAPPEQLPAWLSDLRIEPVEVKAAPEPAAKRELPAPAAPGQPAAGELPDWLKSLSELQPASAAPAGPLPKPAPSAAASPGEASPPSDALAPAEIPAWVLELRPGAVASVSGEILETSGLLAGIRGALPVEPVVSMPHKWSSVPPAMAPIPVAGFTELHAPKPDTPAAAPAAPVARRSGCLGRLGLPLLILGLISIAFLPFPNASDWRGAAIAAYQPSRDFYQTINHINGLQPDALALIAIDYGAQSRAELDPQARAVLSHLFQNKQRMIVLSLAPEGGAIAQDLLASRNPANSQFNYPYVYGQTHINFGYQAGGEAALRRLAQEPLSALSPDFRDGLPAANWPITKNWKTLDDIALIVVFSDDGAQVVRWIEQLGARADRSPRTLLAGVSKSAESVVMPYYASRQLNGLLAGMHGAAEYEGFLLQPASAAATLDGVSYVVILMVAVIGLSLVATALKRRVS